ncbi:unnamed protein product, partial [Phaeothamnion confervicola]
SSEAKSDCGSSRSSGGGGDANHRGGDSGFNGCEGAAYARGGGVSTSRRRDGGGANGRSGSDCRGGSNVEDKKSVTGEEDAAGTATSRSGSCSKRSNGTGRTAARLAVGRRRVITVDAASPNGDDGGGSGTNGHGKGNRQKSSRDTFGSFDAASSPVRLCYGPYPYLTSADSGGNAGTGGGGDGGAASFSPRSGFSPLRGAAPSPSLAALMLPSPIRRHAGELRSALPPASSVHCSCFASPYEGARFSGEGGSEAVMGSPIHVASASAALHDLAGGGGGGAGGGVSGGGNCGAGG